MTLQKRIEDYCKKNIDELRSELRSSKIDLSYYAGAKEALEDVLDIIKNYKR